MYKRTLITAFLILIQIFAFYGQVTNIQHQIASDVSGHNDQVLSPQEIQLNNNNNAHSFDLINNSADNSNNTLSSAKLSSTSTTSVQSQSFTGPSVTVNAIRKSVVASLGDFGDMYSAVSGTPFVSSTDSVTNPLYAQDNNFYMFYYTFSSTTGVSSANVYLNVKMHVGNSNGKIYQNFVGTMNGLDYYTSETNNSFDLSKNPQFVDSDGYMNLLVNVFFDSGQDIYNLSIFIISDSGVTRLIDSKSTPISGADANSITVEADRLVFVPNNTTYNDRLNSVYKGNGQYQHTLSINNFDYNTNYTVSAPMDMELLNINPQADAVIKGNDYNIFNTVPTTYTLTFGEGPGFGRNFKKTASILPIIDKTSDFLSCPSFETCWINDWTNDPYNLFETVSLSNNYAYDHLSSLYLSNTVGSGDLYLTLPNGVYYITYSAYVQSISGTGSIGIYGWDGSSSSWQGSLLNTSTTSRWQTVENKLTVINSDSNSEGNFKFSISNGVTAKLYLDDIHIDQISTTTQTIQSNQLQITSQLNWWTNYDLEPALRKNTSLTINDRTNQHSIFHTYITSDASGILSYVYNGPLNLQEYSIYLNALDNTWSGTYTQTYLGYYDYFKDVLGTPMTFDSTVQGWLHTNGASIEQFAGMLQVNTNETDAGAIYNLPEYVSSEVFTNISFDLSCVTPTTLKVFHDNSDPEDSAGNYYYDFACTETITPYVIPLSYFAPTGLASNETSDFNSIWFFSSNNNQNTFFLDNIKLTGHKDYASTTTGSAWDWETSREYFYNELGLTENFYDSTTMSWMPATFDSYGVANGLVQNTSQGNQTEFFTDVLGTPMNFDLTSILSYNVVGGCGSSVSSNGSYLIDELNSAGDGCIIIVPTMPIDWSIFTNLSFNVYSPDPNILWNHTLPIIEYSFVHPTGTNYYNYESIANNNVSSSWSTITANFSDFTTAGGSQIQTDLMGSIVISFQNGISGDQIYFDNFTVTGANDYSTYDSNIHSPWNWGTTGEYFYDQTGIDQSFSDSTTDGWQYSPNATTSGSIDFSNSVSLANGDTLGSTGINSPSGSTIAKTGDYSVSVTGSESLLSTSGSISIGTNSDMTNGQSITSTAVTSHSSTTISKSGTFSVQVTVNSKKVPITVTTFPSSWAISGTTTQYMYIYPTTSTNTNIQKSGTVEIQASYSTDSMVTSTFYVSLDDGSTWIQIGSSQTSDWGDPQTFSDTTTRTSSGTDYLIYKLVSHPYSAETLTCTMLSTGSYTIINTDTPSVNLQVSTNGGSSYSTVSSSTFTPDDTSHTFTLSDTATRSTSTNSLIYRLLLTTANLITYDISATTETQATYNVINPDTPTVTLQYSLDGGTTWGNASSQTWPNDASQTFTLTDSVDRSTSTNSLYYRLSMSGNSILSFSITNTVETQATYSASYPVVTVANTNNQFLKISSSSASILSIEKSGLSIDASTYTDFLLEFNSSVTVTGITLLDSSLSVICSDTSSWSADVAHVYSCTTDSYWTGTETNIKLLFSFGTASAVTIYINAIYLYDSVGSILQGFSYSGTSPGADQFVDPSGYLTTFLGTGTSGSYTNIITPTTLQISSSIYRYLTFRLKVSGVSSYHLYIRAITSDSSDSLVCDLGSGTTTNFKIYTCDLGKSSFWISNSVFKELYIQIYFYNPIYPMVYLDYIHLTARSLPSPSSSPTLSAYDTGSGIAISTITQNIDADSYYYAFIEFFPKQAISSIYIFDDYDMAHPLCSTDTVFSANTWSGFSCDLPSTLWNSTDPQNYTHNPAYFEPGFTILFGYSDSGPHMVYIQHILLYDTDNPTQYWDQGTFNYSYVDPQGQLTFRASKTSDTISMFSDIPTNFQTSEYRYLTIKVKSSVPNVNVSIYTHDDNLYQSNTENYTITSANTWYIFKYDLASIGGNIIDIYPVFFKNGPWSGNETISFDYALLTAPDKMVNNIFSNQYYFDLPHAQWWGNTQKNVITSGCYYESSCVQIIEGSGSYFYPEVNFGSMDLSATDGIRFKAISNVSMTLDTIFLVTDANNFFYYTGNWHLSTKWDDIYISGYESVGQPDISDIAYMVFYYTQANSSLTISDFHFASGFYSYFTPTNPSETEFFTYVTGNPIDFSSGDTNGLTIPFASNPNTDIVSNGYLNVSASGSSTIQMYSGFTAVTSSKPLDTSYYNYAEIRVFATYSNLRVNLETTAGHFAYNDINSGGSCYTVANTWVTCEFEKNSNYNSISNLALDLLQAPNQGDLNGSDHFYIDYIRIVHRDSNLLHGFDYEFNQPESIGLTDNAQSSIYPSVCNRFTPTTFDISNNQLIYIGQANDGFYFNFHDFSSSSLNSIFDDILIKGRLNYGSFSYNWRLISNSSCYYGDFVSAGATYSTLGQFTFELPIPANSNAYSIILGTSDSSVTINSIQLIKKDTSEIVQKSNNYVILSNTEKSYNYNVWLDGASIGHYTSSQQILINGSVGNHVVRYQAFSTVGSIGTFVSSVIYEFNYSIIATGTENLVFRDQQGLYISPNTFNVYVDGERIVDGAFYISDTSKAFNLTVTDAWNYTVYSNPNEMFISIKDFTVTLYSLKIQNMQDNPIWVQFVRGSTGASFSSWVFPYEVQEFKVIPAIYTTTIWYSDVANASLGFAVAKNGYKNSYSYPVTQDTAIRVTGTSIQDVFNNVYSLSQNLDTLNSSLTQAINNGIGNQTLAINSTIQSQTNNITLSFTNTNNIIGEQNNLISIILDNTNTTIKDQLNHILGQFNNIDSIIGNQTNQISMLINDTRDNIVFQYNNISSDISTLKTDLTLQFNNQSQTINDIDTNVATQIASIVTSFNSQNSTIYNQTMKILLSFNYTNTALYQQTVHILNAFNYKNTTLYQQTVHILNAFDYTNTTLYQQTVSILNAFDYTNTTLYNQTVQILNAFNSTDTAIFGQTVQILSTFNMTNTTLYQQTVNILSSFTDINTQINAQTVNFTTGLNDVNSNILSQTLDILSRINNTNTTIQSQVINVLTQLTNLNSSIASQQGNISQALTNISLALDSVGSTRSFSVVLVSPGGLIYSPYPVFVYVNYSYYTFSGNVVKSTELYLSSQNLRLPNSTLVTVTLKSGFGDRIYNSTFLLTSNLHYTVQLNITTLTISNTATTVREVDLYRHGILGYNVTINPGESVTLQLLLTKYVLQVYEVFDRPIVNQYNQTLTKKLLNFTTLTLKSAGSHLSLSSASGGVNAEQVKAWFQDMNPVTLMTLIVSGAVGTIVATVATIVVRRIVLQKIKEKEHHVRVYNNNK